MKIGIFCPYNIMRPGGVQDIVSYQLKELLALGHDVQVITPRPRDFHGEPPKHTLFVGISTKVKAQSSTPDISAAIDADEINAFFGEHTFDVIHFHEPVVPFVGRQLIAACPCPVVATLHAALPDTAIGKTLGSIKPYFRSVLQHVDVFTKVSEPAGEYLGDLLDDQTIYLVPNGVSVNDFRASSKRNKDTILYINRLEKRKGPKYLIEAFAELLHDHPNLHLQIVGDGHDRTKLEQLVERLGIVRNVEFKGFVSQKEKISLLQRATFACYPAIYGEAFGIVLLEAMATGTPLIAGDNPGYASVLKEKGLLSLVDPTDQVEFTRRMKLLVENEDIRNILSAWGLEFVKQFDYPKIVQQYLHVYKLAIKQGKQT